MDGSWLDLRCQKEFCIYRNIAKIFKNGGLLLENTDLSSLGGLAIYDLGNKPSIKAVRKSFGDRYWTIHKKIKAVVQKYISKLLFILKCLG